MIRPATESDFPRLNALIHDCGLAVEGIDYRTWGPVTLVEERNGEVRGFVQAVLGKPYAVISEMAVDPIHQRKGIGARLLSHLETVLREYGVTAWVAFAGEKSDASAQLTRWATRMQGTGVAFVRRLQ